MKNLGLVISSILLVAMLGCSSSGKSSWVSDPSSSTAKDRSAVNNPGLAEKKAQQLDGEIGSDRVGRVRPVIGTQGMVVSDDEIASEWGAEVLRRGGNAIDAAVATGFMLSVTRPHYGSIGGGGFLVYCPVHQECTTIDYREKAPKAASRDMYVKNGKANTDLSQDGAMASGVPGVTSGLLTALEKFGTKKRQLLLSEPIKLARQGIKFTGWEESAAYDRWDSLNDAAKALLGCKSSAGNLGPCPVGTKFVQKDLAKVLQTISEKGRDGFYKGWVAQKLIDGMQKAGGVLTLEDLEKFSATSRKPLTASFRGKEVVTMPPPSSGGALLLQMLGYMGRAEKDGQLGVGFGSVSTIHAEAHAMALAFADRARYFGDTDFVKMPLKQLLSKEYLDGRWGTFDPKRANPPIQAGMIEGEPQSTTHFSVIDAEGNSVAITTTINDEYGSGFVPPGTGIFMNDEMDDFSTQPGVPNMFGLIGGDANSIAAGKRPLSSMTPTIVRNQKGETEIVIGASGGPRIITAVMNVLVDHYEFGMGLSDAVAAPRVHDQWRPNELRIERFGFAPEVRARLTEMGYKLAESPGLAKIQAIERFPNGRSWGVADPRGEGAAVAQ